MIDGKRLRELRKRQRITAEELGKILGVSGQQVLRYETAQSDMTTDMLARIADFFDVSTDYLLGRAEQPTPYERKGVLSWQVDTTRLLETFQPEFMARVVKSLGIRVTPETLEIDVRALLAEFPASHVARFLKELGLRSKLVESPDSPPDLRICDTDCRHTTG